MYQDGDKVILNDYHAEVVGATRQGYDIVRYTDYKVIREVPEHELQPV